MGSTESVPPAYELTGVDGPWLSIARLALDAGPGDRRGRPASRPPGGRPTPPPAQARNRRLSLRSATLEITLEQMNRALAAVPFDDVGVSEARVWMAPDGPRLVGTFSVGNRRASFTVRPTIDVPADGRRRIRVGLSDVRVYGALPLPAPLIGVALASAISTAVPHAGPNLRTVGPHLDIDLLALALEHALVARGWRLPNLGGGRLEAVESVPHGLGGGALRLRFQGDAPGGAREPSPRPPAPADGGDVAWVSAVEGEPVPALAREAEGHLNVGDLVAAEAALRSAWREAPDARPVQARLLALRAAADGADVAELASALNARWPEFVPGWLYAAIAAREAGDAARSAESFGRVAHLCEQRDEREDARLARAAEAEARAAADQIRATTSAPATTGAASEITQQDQPREPAGIEAPEITQQDQPAAEATAALDGEEAPAGEREQAPAAEAATAVVPGKQASELTNQTEQALDRGDLAQADALFARRLEAAGDPARVATLLAERARVQLLGPDGAQRALATLRAAAPAALSEEGLVLRADLAERAGELTDARATLGELKRRAEAAGDAAHARQLAGHLAGLAAAQTDEDAGEHDGETGTTGGAEVDADGVTASTEAVYAEKDPDARAAALGQLLERFDTLPAQRQHAAYTDFARVAESAGDLEHAEEAYWRATRLADDAGRRADDLLAHARVLIARGNVAAATAELEEALTMVPDHAGVLALLAEQAHRTRNWERARHYYALLDGCPDADQVIARDVLLERRATLARAAGDGDEAEACYRELAVLNPRRIEPRQALAELALARDDARTAAECWEEVLRLLPVNALDTVLDVRQRLADLHAGLGNWGAALTYAELVLAQDPGRVSLLERMAQIDEQLGLYPAAVDVLGRLARLYRQPRQRAEALFRQGEILLERMNEPGRAFDAHLKSSDLDPTYTPTTLRLIEGYWRAGDFAEASAVGDELRRTGALPPVTPLLRARWAAAMALAGRRAGPEALADSGLGAKPWDAGAAATVLSEAAAILVARLPRELEPATAVLEAWSRQETGDAPQEATTDRLQSALMEAFTRDPATPGVVRALGWLAERTGDALRARVFYAAAAFADEHDGAASRLDELGLAPVPPPQGLALLGPADDAALSGGTAPLRRTLAALAHALAGFDGTAVPASDDTPATLSGSHLAIEVQADYAALARSMGAPPVVLVPAAAHPDSTGAASRALVPPGGLSVVAGRPATIEIPAGLVGLPHDELTFLVARALDHLRSGLAVAAQAGVTTADELGSLLHGARAALTETPVEAPPLARSTAAALGDARRRNALLSAGGVERVVGDLDQARELTAAWAAFREGAARAGDRFAALACRNPLAALRALYRADNAMGSSTANIPERERRAEFLRSPRVGALLYFLASPRYARALGLATADAET